MAAVFTVDSTVDAVDANPGDGVCASVADGCTLRAAVMETNALPGEDTVSVPPGHYHQGGRLVVTGALTIQGAGKEETILDGGGLSVTATVTIKDVSVIGATGGGGISNYDHGHLSIERCTIASNRGFSQGSFLHTAGGITSTGDSVSLMDTTVKGNSGDIGGVLVYFGSLWIERSTISDNYGSILDGIVAVRGEIVNSTISEGGGVAVDAVDGLVALIHSTVVGEVSGRIAAFKSILALPGDDWLLGPLADNGGPTLTHEPQPGSPAIDAIPVEDCTWDDDGDPGTPEVPLLDDQRGSRRPKGAGCDIGSVEVPEPAQILLLAAGALVLLASRRSRPGGGRIALRGDRR